MSADNAIYIQKRLDGRYWVWHGFASDDVNEPDREKDYSYETKAEALACAQGMTKVLSFLEYGILFLEPEEPESGVLECEFAHYPFGDTGELRHITVNFKDGKATGVSVSYLVDR